MEKGLPSHTSTPSKPLTRRSKLAARPAFLITSLLAFLTVYNFVPQAREKIQSFLTIPHWEEPVPRISLPQGSYVGKILDNPNHPVPVEAFLGIPYALPPTGERRFARAQAVPQSNETFDATEYSPRCPGKQLLAISGTLELESSEDCLTLNVFRWRHSFSQHSKMPVLVYVHGGAFNRGSASMHDTASMLSWSEEPYLAISFNYRLGALGFLNSELAAKEGLLNLGLHDQKFLLEWVQQNVAILGGDPNDITIAGLSAGAHSVGHHILDVNEKRQFFHKAIIESGAPNSRAVNRPDSKLHQAQFNKFVSRVGCASKSQSEVMSCLRAVPFESIAAAQTAVFDDSNPSLNWAWQPVIDNDIISRSPLDAWKSGDWHKVPIMTGFNHNEGSMYVPKGMEDSNEFVDFFATLLPQLSKADLKKLEEIYSDPVKDEASPYVDSRNLPELRLGEQYKRVEAAYGHHAYVCPVRQTVNFVSERQEAPVYLYHWSLNSTVINGANHGDQILYETMSPSVRDVSWSHDKIAKYFNSYLTSFIVTGDPNTLHGKKAIPRPSWAPFTGGQKTMVIGAGNDEAAGGSNVGTVLGAIHDDWAREECRFWWEKSQNSEDN